MYYIRKINTGVPPGLGVPSIWGGVGGGGGDCINHCKYGVEGNPEQATLIIKLWHLY